jgi:hypothetical protein
MSTPYRRLIRALLVLAVVTGLLGARAQFAQVMHTFVTKPGLRGVMLAGW